MKNAPCAARTHKNIGGATVTDYVQHHEPFEFYESTANPDHVAPSSLEKVGYSDPSGTKLGEAVNHQYDLSWFNKAVTEGNMPQVSFVKPPAYENGHAGNSDPLDEQRFLVDEINEIEQSKYWPNTAIVIDYDDSDGWYDHQLGPIVDPSNDTSDQLNGAGKCGTVTAENPERKDRCGVGPRLPLLVISPWARRNYVDGTFTEQSSITKFIEENWNLGKIGGGSLDATSGTLDDMFDFNRSEPRSPAILLNDETGEVESEMATGESNVRDRRRQGRERRQGRSRRRNRSCRSHGRSRPGRPCRGDRSRRPCRCPRQDRSGRSAGSRRPDADRHLQGDGQGCEAHGDLHREGHRRERARARLARPRPQGGGARRRPARLEDRARAPRIPARPLHLVR